MKYIDRMKSILFYYSMTEEDYRKVASDMKKGSLGMMVILSGTSCIIMALLFFYSFFFESWERYRMIYVSFFMVFMMIFLFSKKNKRLEEFSPNISIYGYLAAFYLFTLIDSIILSPNVIALEPVVILFLISAFFYFNLIESIIFISIMTFLNSAATFFYSSEAVKYVNITNFTLYGIVNIVLSFLINKNYAVGFLNAYKARISGYMDSMTGLHNRNYYKFILPSLLKKVRNQLACIYIDANDLHRINNEFGHEEGDKMLTFIAEQTMALASEDYAFRIGGDEFLCFLLDPSMNLEEECEAFKRVVEKEGFHASLGFEIAHRPVEEDMPKLIRAAEKKMYEDKRQFYERTGCDRRKADCKG